MGTYTERLSEPHSLTNNFPPIYIFSILYEFLRDKDVYFKSRTCNKYKYLVNMVSGVNESMLIECRRILKDQT